jgi:hypothetical protein
MTGKANNSSIPVALYKCTRPPAASTAVADGTLVLYNWWGDTPPPPVITNTGGSSTLLLVVEDRELVQWRRCTLSSFHKTCVTMEKKKRIVKQFTLT